VETTKIEWWWKAVASKMRGKQSLNFDDRKRRRQISHMAMKGTGEDNFSAE
jgi:hypothetical protein